MGDITPQCKINHEEALSLPAVLCRACNPSSWLDAAIDDMVERYPETLKGLADGEWPHAVRRDNLTPADIVAIEELTDTRAQAQATKAQNRIAKMKARFDAKAIPEGATWDTRRARWVVPGAGTTAQPCGNSHAKATVKSKRRRRRGK